MTRYRRSNMHSKSWVLLFPALLASLLIAPCEARPWRHEIPTATAVPAPDSIKANDLKPTPNSFLQSFVERKLRRRDEYPDTVCGFIGGDVATPATCSPGSMCLWDTAHGVVGCSPTGTRTGTLAVHTSCVEEDDIEDGDVDNPWVFTCRGTAECFRNTYDAISGRAYYQFGCGSSEWATTVRTQPNGVANQSAKVVLTSINMPEPTVDPSTESTSSPSPTPTTSPPSSTSSSLEPTSSSETSESTTSSTEPPSSTSSTDSESSTSGSGVSTTSSGSGPNNTSGSATPLPNESSSTNIGAIVGGVVGGIVGLALIAGLLFLLKRRKKHENQKRISELSQASSGGLHDMGEVFEPKELDATTAERPSELPGDTTLRAPNKAPEPVELPGSEVPMYQPYRPPGASEKPTV